MLLTMNYKFEMFFFPAVLSWFRFLPLSCYGVRGHCGVYVSGRVALSVTRRLTFQSPNALSRKDHLGGKSGDHSTICFNHFFHVNKVRFIAEQNPIHSVFKTK